MRIRTNKLTIFTVENVLGLVLAILIIFQILPNVSFANSINNPIGIIISLIVVLVAFVLMNPIIGFLVLIYIYEVIQVSIQFNKQINPITRNRDLFNMNRPSPPQLEEIVIKMMAPIKNEFSGNDVTFSPVLEKIKV